MLNIGKLRRGGENYYLNSVARGVEDYYLGSGEAPGYWLAAGASDLRLSGGVGDGQLRNVLRAAHPNSGRELTGPHRSQRVPGFDLTFLAPKSVALLHELGPKEASNEVVNAHDAAVAAALGYLERHAAGARRGKAGRRSIASKGLIAAAFRHRTSRAGDPLLHTHVLVANLIKGEDGKWGALDAKHLYRQAKTAGYLYQAHLRAELTRRLGVEWGPVRKGAADVEGISRQVIRSFSTRRREVEAVLAARTEVTGRERELAALTTRKAKDYRVSPQRLAPQWRAKAESLGLTPQVFEQVLGRSRDRQRQPDSVEIAAKLAAPEGLTAQMSAFSRREALQGFCSELQAGAPVAEIEAMADAFLASDLVVPLSARAEGITTAESQRVSQGRHAAPPEERHYSTTEMLSVERDVIERAIERRLDGSGIAYSTALSKALGRRPSLFPDQRAMVRSLTTSGMGVEVVVGKAGAGKTFALDAAREAWELSGQRVIGCSLSARAAQELESGSGIASYTVASLLSDLDGPDHGGIRADSVVVVDEAGMVGSRDLARLLAHAQRESAKVVLVGDDRQLPEIEAGGAFRGIKNRLPCIELSEVRRQPFGWEREALDLIREGKAQEAIAEYTRHDRVHVASSAEDTRRQLVADWWMTQDDAEPGVMIAARRSDVWDLNARARFLMAADGRLGGEELEFSGQSFSVGDRVMTLRNNPRLGVYNGTRGIVDNIDLLRGKISIRRSDGVLVVLPSSYLEAGHLTHAYAITGHKAQGMTTEQAFVLGDETLYREWAYVAMSRGKHNNSLYVVTGIDPEREELGGEVSFASDPTSELIRALGRSRAKDLALDVYETEEIRSLTFTQLRQEQDLLSRSLSEVPADVSDQLVQMATERQRLIAAIERETQAVEEAHSTIGEVGHLARRRNGRRSAHERRIRDSDRVRSRLMERVEELGYQEAELKRKLKERDDWLLHNAPAVRRNYALERELWWREHQSALAAEVTMPSYLSTAVGERPETPSERAAWRQAVHAIESYRDRWGVTDQDVALGKGTIADAQDKERKEIREELKKRVATQERDVTERSLER